MNDVNPEFLSAYDKYRIEDQIVFYQARVKEYAKADNQALVLRSALLFGAAVCGILGAADIARVPLGIIAAALAALSAAVTAWTELIGFRLNLDLYTNAQTALGLLRPEQPQANARTDEVREYVREAEDILLGEVQTWAQKWQTSEENAAAGVPAARRDDG
jgi:hypothetical protein